MRCFVMQTSQYESEAKKYNCVNFLKRFKRDAESYGDYSHPVEMNFGFGNYIIDGRTGGVLLPHRLRCIMNGGFFGEAVLEIIFELFRKRNILEIVTSQKDFSSNLYHAVRDCDAC